jgi:hypothetical protein
MRNALIGLLLTTASLVTPTANAAVVVNIGINVPTYPSLVRIPDYPVYYAPSMRANYFFYDGLYWVFNDSDGNWYESSWYNGPWYAVDPFDVPDFLLRVPVRYYRAAPSFFRGWSSDRAPLWGSHWGSSWQSRRSGWDNWKRGSAPAPAPLPSYQRSYSGNRYPSNVSQQASIQTRSYTYQPRETIARQQFQEHRAQARSAPQVAPPVQQQTRIAPQPQPQQQQVQQPQRAQRPERAQHVDTQQRAQPPQQQQRAERAQPQQQQQQRAERAQPQQQQRAQPQPQQQQRPERAQQAQPQNKGGQQQHENRGQDNGKGHDRKDNKAD